MPRQTYLSGSPVEVGSLATNCSEFRDHDHTERPHQGLDNELIQKSRKENTSKKLDIGIDAFKRCPMP